ncbi:diguanylate cyclase [Legionella lytica]|uniref:Diguanylate cyclase n=1 Tax=Legionella lytica TaxID=96232 RepID=A0ABY4YB08_9GAMM|nr:diguanylate cyclase [Legionella lytica]
MSIKTRLFLTMSIGVTERALGAQEVGAIMKKADEALYRAKEARRNRVEMEIP